MLLLGLIVTCLLLTRLQVLCVSVLSSGDFHYANGNSRRWKEKFPACDGEPSQARQSPINLDSSLVTSTNKILEKVKILNQTVAPKIWALTANGNTVVLELDLKDSNFEISLDSSSDKVYRLHSIHLHWGDSYATTEGSEHSIDGKRWPVEIHLVHYEKSLGSFENAGAANQTDSSENLAVIGLFGKYVPMNAKESHESIWTRMFGGGFPAQIGLSFMQNSFNVYTAIAKHMDNSSFYRYRGSLTTPPCSQIVVWTVYTEPIPVNHSRSDHFKMSPLNRGAVTNSRELQNFNNRELYFSGVLAASIASIRAAPAVILNYLSFLLILYFNW